METAEGEAGASGDPSATPSSGPLPRARPGPLAPCGGGRSSCEPGHGRMPGLREAKASFTASLFPLPAPQLPAKVHLGPPPLTG